MTLSLDDLIKGPSLPVKAVYIDTLEDTVEIQTVPLERFLQHKANVESLVKAATDAPEAERAIALQAMNDANDELVEIIVAESLSAQTGMTIAEARALNDQVKAKIPPAAWDEISLAVMRAMLGSRLGSDSAGK